MDLTSLYPKWYEKKWHSANRYDALPYISNYYTVTNGSAAFDTLQGPIPHITVCYTCIHKLNGFVITLPAIILERMTQE